ncbi:hypothetical protein EDB19DRAFT_2019977 [Suillus lakei]|nr:hypothetical protein EDB19DRAFT_2019977 [Suillus lakei]
MHVCLLPIEILLHIFAIYKDWNAKHCVTLAALARTCRKFKEPALDILWKDINGFEPLILCLPEGVSNKNVLGKLTLKRPLVNGEWELLYQYARRIHSFRVLPDELDMIDDRVMQSLISAPLPTPLLPNLRSLRWYDGQGHYLPLLCTLLGSTSITFLRLGSMWAPSFANSALLASLGARCPSLRELHCACGGDSEGSEDAIFEALCSLRGLSRLGARVFNTRELLRLASLPSLKYLDLDLRAYNINGTPSNSTPTNFSQLNQVHITALSLSVVNHCLNNVHFPSCQSVWVHFDCIDEDDDPGVLHDPWDIPDLIVSLSECFSPALEELRFIFDPDFEFTSEENTLVNPSFALDFNMIAPLLSFSRLTDVQLDWMCTLAID